MTTKEIERRLAKLRPAHIILEISVDGELRRMTAAEFVSGGYDFLKARIVAGNSLLDAGLILDPFPSSGIQ